MNTTRDLTKVLQKYKGLWVVLNKSLNKVISADKNAKRAYELAITKGEKQPTLFKVPQKNLPYFGKYSSHGEM